MDGTVIDYLVKKWVATDIYLPTTPASSVRNTILLL